METKNYVVEQMEHGQWVPKMRSNFEDENFPLIAKNNTYRILCNGVDITYKYNEDAPKSTPTHNEPAMKPAQYKALSQEEKDVLKMKATQLKELKKKRTEILSELNITESTYDAIRADMFNDSDPLCLNVVAAKVTESDKLAAEPKVEAEAKPAATVRKGGLLGRR